MFGFQSNIRMVVSPLLVVFFLLRFYWWLSFIFVTVVLVAVIRFCHYYIVGCQSSFLSRLYWWLSVGFVIVILVAVIVFVTVILLAESRRNPLYCQFGHS